MNALVSHESTASGLELDARREAQMRSGSQRGIEGRRPGTAGDIRLHKSRRPKHKEGNDGKRQRPAPGTKGKSKNKHRKGNRVGPNAPFDT
jgi:hypothetical protein